MPPTKGVRAAAANSDDRLDDGPLVKKLAQANGTGRGRRPAATATVNAVEKAKDVVGTASDSLALPNGINATTSGTNGVNGLRSKPGEVLVHRYS
jgi:hypothetical protein